MRSCLSRLLLSSGLVSVLFLGAGCGPKEAFCPNVGADAGGVCPIFGDDAMAPLQDTGVGGNICPSGQHLGDNPDGNMNPSGPNGGLVCVCVGTEKAPPCN